MIYYLDILFEKFYYIRRDKLLKSVTVVIEVQYIFKCFLIEFFLINKNKPILSIKALEIMMNNV